LHLQLEHLKDKILHTHDFTMKKAFNAVDDWSYGWIDASNLKRFLVNMGYRHPSAHRKGWKKALDIFLHAVIRRFDLTGDSRISFEEFK
jgi:Ca2+-binding EF-hand superfamily protein